MSKSFMTLMFIIIYMNMIILLLNNIYQKSISIVSMIITIILFNLMIALSFSLNSQYSIYSFIYFMSLNGGLMILFMFFISLIANESIHFNININYYLTFLLLFILLINLWLKNNSFSKLNNMIINHPNIWMNINYLYNYPYYLYMIMMMLYLLITLIMITKICLMNNKPLRKSKYVQINNKNS